MIAQPLLFALLMWFIGTASIVWLVSRPRATFAVSLTLAGAAAISAMVLSWSIAGRTDAAAAYLGFGAAIVIWGWHEMSFLTGIVAGPNRLPCPPSVTGWPRFAAATATVIHHELAIAATAILLFASSWGQPNQTAALTFLLLFVLRLSAKFNLYLGVPNLSDEIFPAHLAHLKSYFRVAPLNALFPLSILFGSAIVIAAWNASFAAPAGSGAAVGFMLIAGLAVLGVVEHLFLVLPMRDSKMWSWASATGKAAKTASIE